MPDTTVLERDFNWHDASGSGDYDWGASGYLKLDGSSGRIQCRRRLKEPIANPGGAVEFSVHFTLGKSYRILLYDAAERPVVECFIDRDGQVRFHDGNGYVDGGVGIGTNELWTVESEPLRLRFSHFDHQQKTFRFELDDQTVEGMPLRAQSTDVSHLELQTEVVEPGAVLWIQAFRQTQGEQLIDEEHFTDHWETLPYIPTGHAQEKWDSTSYRPMDYRWLEVRTRYGAAYTSFAPIAKGSIELDMMTQDVNQETQISLGEYQPWVTPVTPGFWKLVLGIFAGMWTPFQDWVREDTIKFTQPFGYGMPFDNAPAAENDRSYHVRIEWEINAQTWQVWIDGTELRYKGSSTLKAFSPVDKGIDTLMFHPGNLNPTAGPMLRYHLGGVRVRSAS